MKLVLLSLLIGASAYAATPSPTTPFTTAPDGKVHFEVWAPFDQIHQPLQVLNLERTRPELYMADVRYSIAPDVKFADTTQWRTAYVAQYERPRLAEWLQCVYFDAETHTCATLLNISFKSFKSKEKELRQIMTANFEKAKEMRTIHTGATFINGTRYDLPLAYGQLLNEVNPLLPKQAQLTGLGKYEVTTLFAVGTTESFGMRDLALEKEFVRWIPNLKIQPIDPNSSKGIELLTATESTKIPAYVFDKASARNSAVQKLTVAGRATIRPSGYGIFDLKSGGTEIRMIGKETPNQLDLWVMSECPYGVRAENVYQAAVEQKLVNPAMKINLRYIASERKVDGKMTWSALHGERELNENMRQLAIQKTWPNKFWQYLEARNANLETDWKEVATSVGLDPKQVEGKMSLGRKLMAQDIKDGAALKITGSPTYLWQNRIVLNSPEEFTKTIGYNPTEVFQKMNNEPTEKREPSSQPAPAAAAAPAGGQCG